MHGTKTFGYCFIVFLWCISACSPVRRVNRIIKKHPEVLDSFTKTEILVRNQQVHDTTLLFKSDTIVTEFATIYRTSDTIRIITRERPCTTYVQTTQITPKEIIKAKKERKGAIHEILILVRDIVLMLLACTFFVFCIRLLRR
jgi:hypothetical protein